jgi:uncharacterized protein (DUF952 family)
MQLESILPGRTGMSKRIGTAPHPSVPLDGPHRARHDDPMIYKIFRRDEWDQLQRDGATAGAPIDVTDGFVHFSTPAQVRETASKHFAGEDGLFLVAVNEKTLGKDLKWEPSRGGALFPHLYRKLTTADVVSVHRIDMDGARHVFPDVIP